MVDGSVIVEAVEVLGVGAVENAMDRLFKKDLQDSLTDVEVLSIPYLHDDKDTPD